MSLVLTVMIGLVLGRTNGASYIVESCLLVPLSRAHAGGDLHVWH